MEEPINHQITVDEAAKMTALWREVVNETGTDNVLTEKLKELRAFNIPYNDLSNLLKVEGAVNFRAYMACSAEQAKDDPLHSPYKLIFVATDKYENDLTQFVYDFTNPCPGSCGTQPSILLNDKNSSAAQ